MRDRPTSTLVAGEAIRHVRTPWSCTSVAEEVSPSNEIHTVRAKDLNGDIGCSECARRRKVERWNE
jgi:hypothetical protein